jgi:hypothetical protein
MPRQITGIEVSDNGDGTCNIQIGPFIHTRPLSVLFDRSSQDEDSIRQNVGLAFRISGVGVPNSREFVDVVNSGAKGMEGRSGRVFITSIDDEGDGNFRIWFGPRATEPQFGIPVSMAQLSNDEPDDEKVIANLAAFLRLGHFDTLSNGAINAIRVAKFWK